MDKPSPMYQTFQRAFRASHVNKNGQPRSTSYLRKASTEVFQKHSAEKIAGKNFNKETVQKRLSKLKDKCLQFEEACHYHALE